MLDVLHICWWFLQVTLVGYLCVYRLLDNDNDRLLFAPVAGFSAVLIVANTLWMWSFSTYVMSFLLAFTVGAGIILTFRLRPRPSAFSAVWLIIGVVLVALHGSLIPFAERAFQAFPLDRFGYLISYVLLQQHSLSFFTDAAARLGFNGDKQVLFLHPLVAAAFNEMKARAGCGLAFISLSWRHWPSPCASWPCWFRSQTKGKRPEKIAI